MRRVETFPCICASQFVPDRLITPLNLRRAINRFFFWRPIFEYTALVFILNIHVRNGYNLGATRIKIYLS